MGRSIQPEKYQKIKDYLVKGDVRIAFWYTEEERRDINMQTGMAVASSTKVLETYSNQNFEVNDEVEIGGRTYLIDDVQLKPTADLNTLRGKPTFMKIITLK